MIKYQYQIIRYIPDQFTGEFANVGIVLFSPKNHFLSCRVTNKYARLSEFFGQVHGTFLMSSLRHFENQIKAVSDNFQGIFLKTETKADIRQITAPILLKDDSALQLTEPFFGMDLDAEKALNDLFDRIVEKYNPDSTAVRHTDQYAWSKVYKSYFDKYGITKKLIKHSVSTKKDEIEFDKAWKNGVWNCYQTLSFDLKTEDAIKSKVYKWSGIIKALEASKEKMNLFFLTTSPREHQDLESFIKDTLNVKDDKLKIKIVKEQEADSFVQKVRKDMEKSKVLQDDEFDF